MATFKIQLHPRKSFLFLGRITLTYDAPAMEVDLDMINDSELRAIINGVISYNLECDKSIAELAAMFRQDHFLQDLNLGLLASRTDLNAINQRYKPSDIEVESGAPTLEEMKDDFKVKYSHLVDFLHASNDEGAVIGYLRDMQLNPESEHYNPIEVEALDFLTDVEKSSQGRKGVVKALFSIIASYSADQAHGLIPQKSQVPSAEFETEKTSSRRRKTKE